MIDREQGATMPGEGPDGPAGGAGRHAPDERSAGRWWRLDLSVGQRLALGFGAAGVLIALMGAISHLEVTRVANLRHRLGTLIAPRAAAAARLEHGVLHMAIAARNCVLFPDVRRREAYDEAERSVRGELQTLVQLSTLSDEATGLVARLPAEVDRYAAAARALIAAAQAKALVEELEPEMASAREELLRNVHAYAEVQQRRLEEQRASIAGAMATMDRNNLWTGALLVLVLALTGYATTRSVRQPALALVASARRLGAGDFGHAIELARGLGPGQARRDELAELAQAFGKMALELRAREERLRGQNEELQGQKEELQAQQEELQAQQEELQVQNEELHAQGEELRHSEESLREADRNKNEFLAVLSHELRNPLAPIQNSLHILERAAPGSAQARRAQAVVARQVRHLTRLVEDLLDVTRISNGKVRLQRAHVELARIVRQVAEDNAALFAERGVELRVEVAAEPSVDGDPARLAQIVGNLLQNAAKFTPSGGRVLLALDAAGAKARLRVRDTGAGLTPETLGRLFQPFMQADVTLARTDGGLGLGLALVKGLVELHGGTVRAQSEGPGKGAEFVIELPRSDGATATAPAAPPPPRLRRRVLVIEDNVDAAESLRDALALEGHEVEIAFLGADGIERARAWGPDVVLCDIGLPDVAGHEVARAFRGDPVLRQTFLVALTGYALPEDQKRAREAGFDEHLAKPPSMRRLAELLAAAGARQAMG
ncbi:MAG TPA: ATP-binding protein [Anaeromyxobacter sp.]|nr:ATP-binding protein [Anaeromyxobacter sp.]